MIYSSFSEAGPRVLLFFSDFCFIYDNILDNSVKYTPEGGEIKVFTESFEMYNAIHVVDSGPGISEEEAARIFGRFYRGNAVKQEEGIGIGLYLAREIISKEEGYIKVVPNNKRKGGEIVVYLRK